MLAGSETGGALRDPRSGSAKQVQPTSVTTLLIIWNSVGIHVCHGDYGDEVMPQFGRDPIPLPVGVAGVCAWRWSPALRGATVSLLRARCAWLSPWASGNGQGGWFGRG